uniref:Uncharacterized protein n=1 Tax=Cannabis sativa TaxID=3483 RepID=A0A803QBH2_CANSA
MAAHRDEAVEGAMVMAEPARVVVVDAEAVMSKMYACYVVPLNDENVQVNLETWSIVDGSNCDENRLIKHRLMSFAKSCEGACDWVDWA